MINSSVDFDVFQQLVLWLSKSMHSYREGRHYLEKNTTLIAHETDKELKRLITAYGEDQLETIEQMDQHLSLLCDTRNRGGNIEAMRDAYINVFGGWILDIPSWLSRMEEDFLFLNKLGRPERTKYSQIKLLQDAIDFAEQDERIEPEVLAELRNQLGTLLLQSPLPHTHKDYTQAIQQSISCHSTALKIYTLDRYPLQYAKSQILLGIAYHNDGIAGQPYSIEQAIGCYQAALQVYTHEAFPKQWARLHTYLGNALALCSEGTKAENIEQALSHHLAALYGLDGIPSPLLSATVSFHLGDAYSMRRVEDRKKNVEEAITHYKAAMQTLSLKDFPYEWACIHMRLAAIFEHCNVPDKNERDMFLRCAIVCYEGALGIYRADAFLVERADIQVRLAYAHLLRKEGDRQQHFDQAMKNYKSAIQVFSQDAFPREYEYIQQMISWIETQPHEKELQILPSFHAPFNSCIMIKSS